MNSQDDDLDALRRLASDRREGTAGAKKPTPRGPGLAKSTSKIEDLADLVGHRTTGTSASAPSGSAQTGSAQSPAAQESLEGLLQGNLTSHIRTVEAAKSPIGPAESIADLVHRSPLASSQRMPAPGATAPAQTKALPVELTREAFSEDELPVERPARTFQISHWVQRAGIGLLVVGLAFAGYRYHVVSKTYPTPLAEKVAELASETEAYYAKHRVMPKTLMELDGFPSGAIQWPVENYGLRSKERRVEFFFGSEVGNSFFVIGRYGEEAWLFANDQQPNLQQVPAY